MRRIYVMAMSFCLSACLAVRLLPVKFVKSFTRWQHLGASGGLLYRLCYSCGYFAIWYGCRNSSMLLLVFGPFSLVTERGDDEARTLSLTDTQVSTALRYTIEVCT